MSEISRLERLFDIYAFDLSSCTTDSRDVFICPLCLKRIIKSRHLQNIVSEEHILPESLGGSLTTLTCKECNNRQGSQLDASLVQRVRVEQGEYPINGRVFIGEGEFGADTYFPNDENAPIKIVGIPKQSNPKSVETSEIALRSGPENISLRLNFDYNPTASLVALLRVAYLMMFRCFGYRYILQDFTEQIRKQIKYPFEETLVLKGVRWQIEDIPFPNTITVIEKPENLQAFYVILKLTKDIKHLSGVILPGFDNHNESIYERLMQVSDKVSLRLVLVTTVPPLSNDILNPFQL